MPDPRVYAGKAEAARKQGLAPRELIQQARPGAVFAVNDEAIAFPGERLHGSRKMHETRRVIIVQDAQLNILRNPNTVSVVPCSASQTGPVGDWEFSIPSGEEAFDAASVIAYLSLLQPVLKSDLVKCYGCLRDVTLLKIQMRIAQNLGLIASSSVNLPPRIKVSKADDVLTPRDHAVLHFDGSTDPDR